MSILIAKLTLLVVNVLVVKIPSNSNKADAFLIMMTSTVAHNKNTHVLSVEEVMNLRKGFAGLESAALGRKIGTVRVA